MVYPDFETFADMARQGNLIPVYREILGDLETPVSAYKKLRGEGCSFLLESVEGGEKWGRFSFLGLNPSLMFQVEGGKTVIHRDGRQETLDPAADPFEHLRRLLAGFIPVATPGLPRFWGGLVGYLGYDMVRYIERLPVHQSPHRHARGPVDAGGQPADLRQPAPDHQDPDPGAPGPGRAASGAIRPGGGGHRRDRRSACASRCPWARPCRRRRGRR